jgi:ABC-type branched-subunit amino acid transport system substrate-binding protein
MISRRNLALAALGGALAPAWSATAATEDLVALQVGPWVGTSGETGWSAHVGTQLAFDEYSARGGFKGRRLKLVFEEEDAAAPAAQLQRIARQLSPVALVGSVNAAWLARLARENVLESLQLPAIGVQSGDPALRQIATPYLFITRPSLLEELKAVFSHLATINATQVALVVSPADVADGEFAQHAAAAARSAGVQIVGSLDYGAPLAPEDAVRKLAALRHNAVVIAASTLRTSDFCRAYKTGARSSAQLVSLSTAEPTRLASFSSKTVARGVMFSLAVPNPRNRNLPLVHEFLAAFTRYGPAGVSPTTGMFESYISGRVLVDALQRASAPTSAAVAAVLGKSSSSLVSGTPVYYQDKAEMNRASLTILDDEGKMIW